MRALNDRLSLLEFQDEQRRHDQVAHFDILCLPVRDRLKHMVLHQAKYAGKLYELNPDSDAAVLATVVDVFIICLATANILNLDLQKRVLGNGKVVPFVQRGMREDKDQFASLLRTLILETGRMAKACESLDHVEKFDYRGTIEQSTVELTAAVLTFLSTRTFDLTKAVRTRWLVVEQKSIFASKLGNASSTDTIGSAGRSKRKL